jgi:hypothetical protein
MFFGILGAVFTSNGGKVTGLFTPGQMLEWGCTISGAFLTAHLYLILNNKKVPKT